MENQKINKKGGTMEDTETVADAPEETAKEEETTEDKPTEAESTDDTK